MGITPEQRQQRRDVGWVLRQAAVIGVLVFLAVHVVGVVCLTKAHRELTDAARGAAAEARLAKASLSSVAGEASRRLGGRHRNASVAVSVYRGPGSSRRSRGLRSGDRVSVHVTSPARPLLPDVLARLAPWLAREEVVAEALAVVP